MSFSSDSKEQISLKKLVGKAHTKNESEFYNESKKSGITINANTVFAEDLPVNPGSGSQYQVTSNIVEYVRLPLTPLQESVQNGRYHAFSAALPSTYTADSNNLNKGNGIFDSDAEIHASLGKIQLVPNSFGDVYEVKVFKGGDAETLGDGSRIPVLDDRKWYFDYFNGILFQQNPPDNPNPPVTANGDEDHLTNNPNNPNYIEAYVYIGKMASDRFSEGSSGGDGLDGVDGADFEFKGNIPSKQALLGVSSPEKGWAYIVATDENNNNLENVFYAYDGTSWISGGSLKGDNGLDGSGFTGGSYNPATGQVTLTHEDSQLNVVTGDLRGADGVGIQSTTDNSDGTFTITFTDESEFTTANLTGPQGPVGVSLSSASLSGSDLVLTLTDSTEITINGVKGTGFTGGSYNPATGQVTFTHEDNQQSFTTDDLRGADGVGIASTTDNSNGTFTITFTDASTFTTANLTGPQGDAGSSINFKGQVAQNPSGSGQVTLLGSPEVSFTPANGDAVISTVDYSLFIYNGTTWVSGGSIQGPQGVQGEAGSSIIFRGAVSSDPASTTSITTTDGVSFTPSVGDAVLSQVNDSLFIYNGSAWVSGGSLQGPQGPRGEQGPGIIFRGAVSSDPASTTSITTTDEVTFVPEEGDAVLSQASDSLFIYNGTTWVSGGSIQGLQGETGTAAPVITDITIANNVITTTLDDNSTVDGTFTASINSLSDVDTADHTGEDTPGQDYSPREGQVLKWTLVDDSDANNPVHKWVPADDTDTTFQATTSSLWAESSTTNEAGEPDLYPHGIIDGTLDTGMFAIELSAGNINLSGPDTTIEDIVASIQNMNAYTLSNREDSSDIYWEYVDPNHTVSPEYPEGNYDIMPK